MNSPIGWIEVEAVGEVITGCTFADRKPTHTNPSPSAALRAALKSLERYFEGDLAALTKVEIALEGTDFRKRVWQELRRIPAGKPISYGEVAARLGSPGASRAVGTSCGANPVCLFVPCHRVIAAGGALGGFGGGLWRKEKLLQLEAS